MTILLAIGIPLGYLAISGMVSRKLMRMILERPVCIVHQEGWYTGRCSYRHYRKSLDEGRPMTKPLGEVTDRPVGFAILAATLSLFWPLFILPVIAMSANPTGGELRRRNNELEQTIRDLESKIK